MSSTNAPTRASRNPAVALTSSNITSSSLNNLFPLLSPNLSLSASRISTRAHTHNINNQLTQYQIQEDARIKKLLEEVAEAPIIHNNNNSLLNVNNNENNERIQIIHHNILNSLRNYATNEFEADAWLYHKYK